MHGARAEFQHRRRERPDADHQPLRARRFVVDRLFAGREGNHDIDGIRHLRARERPQIARLVAMRGTKRLGLRRRTALYVHEGIGEQFANRLNVVCGLRTGADKQKLARRRTAGRAAFEGLHAEHRHRSGSPAGDGGAIEDEQCLAGVRVEPHHLTVDGRQAARAVGRTDVDQFVDAEIGRGGRHRQHDAALVERHDEPLRADDTLLGVIDGGGFQRLHEFRIGREPRGGSGVEDLCGRVSHKGSVSINMRGLAHEKTIR